MAENIKPIGTLESAATTFGIAALVGVAAFALLFLIGDWNFSQSVFGGAGIAAILGLALYVSVGRPLAPPTTAAGTRQMPTETRANAEAPGKPGMPEAPPDAQPATRAPSPHRTEPERSIISMTMGNDLADPNTNKSISPGPGGTPAAQAAPATRIPGPAPVNAASAAIARPVGATFNPSSMLQPTPLRGAVVSPEPPVPLAGEPEYITREEAAPTGGTRPMPSATAEAQSYNEVDPIQPARQGGASGGGASDGEQAARTMGATATGGAETTAGSTGGRNVSDGTPAGGGSGTGARAVGIGDPAGADDLDRDPGSVRHAEGTKAADAETFQKQSDAVAEPQARSTGDPDVDAHKPEAAAQPGSGASDAHAGADASETESVHDAGTNGGTDVEADAAAPGSAIWEADGGKSGEAADDAAETLAEDDGAAPETAGLPQSKPKTLDAPEGEPDDLKRIRGVGPKLQDMLNGMGVYHFDQIASWGPEEVAWVDHNLEGFKGRVSRDDWVTQAKTLASGGETDFSQRVDEGDVTY